MLTAKQKAQNLSSFLFSWTVVFMVVALALAAFSYEEYAFFAAVLGVLSYIVSKGARLCEVLLCMPEAGIIARIYLIVINLFLGVAAAFLFVNLVFKGG